MVIGESSASGSGDNNFYGVLDEVFYIQHPMERSVWLFNLDDVENEQLNVLEIIVGHRVDGHIEDDTLMVERLVVCHVADDFIDDDDEQLSHQSESSDDE
ncbi:uncharacterized protein E5676_scaffold302G001990 [Cucumis melo var. makuwa]|uniref:Uncharacterized protein n=1 Tax=Cucumis melo var. makuwa TaxID=1194695 RepID=A0A5A7UL14_CUCMM|nr:uncharacterized protein E6C27_scaffold24G001090 [Cucumis melo var. makuwa]TYK12412.1 uncharacterized protein E5676_scaffold302G001990 [Cucumis melo var. makuwa]